MTSELTQVSTQKKMSSREIATLTEKRHCDVMRDIRNMLEQLKLDTTQFCVMRKADNGQNYEEYLLPFHELHVLLTGYSIPLRSKVLKRWEELETGEAVPVVKDLQQQEVIKQLTEYNAHLKSKLEEKEQIIKRLQPAMPFGEVSPKTKRKKTVLVDSHLRSPALRCRGYSITAMSPTGELVQMFFPFIEIAQGESKC